MEQPIESSKAGIKEFSNRVDVNLNAIQVVKNGSFDN